MKHFISLILVFVIVLSSFALCFAQTAESGAYAIAPRYIGTERTVESFSINAAGQASFKAELFPMTASSFDTVKVNITIKKADGSAVLDKEYTAEWMSAKKIFCVQSSHQLSAKGSYQMQATYKCYKNNKLIETIPGKKQAAAY